MSFSNFKNTILFINNNSFVNKYNAISKHLIWQLRKIFNFFPVVLKLKKFNIVIKDKNIANGCGGLINLCGYYDSNNMHFIDEAFESGVFKNFIDVGANIGIYSLIACRNSDTKVISIEPHPFTNLLLTENIRINHLSNQIIPLQIALSDMNEKVHFTNLTEGTINQIVKGEEDFSNTIIVDSLTGNELCTMNKFKPDVIKIDVEGHENDVISGFSDILKNVKILFIECQNVKDTSDLLLKNYDFAGPYKIDYKNRIFNYHFNSSEDWVFLNNNFLDEINKLSFNII